MKATLPFNAKPSGCSLRNCFTYANSRAALVEENFQALQSPYTSGKLCGYAERPNTKLTFSKYTARHKKMLANSSSVHEQSEEKLPILVVTMNQSKSLKTLNYGWILTCNKNREIHQILNQ